MIKYKHIAPKPPFEIWYLENISCHLESRLPSHWTANTITFIGNLALPTAGLIALYVGGVRYHTTPEDKYEMV